MGAVLPQKMLVQLLLEEGTPVEIEVKESDNVLEKVCVCVT